MTELISIKNLTFKYDEEESNNVLNDISLTVNKGEWISIVGHNGSGKSTLAKFFNGLLTPSEPNVVKVCGFDTVFEDHIWEVRKQIGMVFQNPDNQMVATTVRDDVAFGLENIGIDREEMLTRINWALQKVKMENYLNHEPHRLSGGQKQRVAIAGIIAMRPSVLILDESTSMLDPMGRKEVFETVMQLNKDDGITVINITHDLEETILSDKIIVMNKGRISIQGKPGEVYKVNDKLTEAGLELPFSLQIQTNLANQGLEIGSVCLTKEGLVNELWKLKSQT
ncbi:energy-coupling factor ABC transporter ATP-binding protein [Anaerobacillus isosaccharinicus]|uniref:Energy-coupling factor ABC transporter ATP-binding protein n=1 Tax=Anaerobacillus isosaccharinicus TaxID=1532552 RepID=A0A1S2MFL8_9BACI|nr:energy-coupling factor ABC transporter ATP-binding protein [Anaerobacillus isosaccharinicus]MBA5584028.1 energy-coupling factor ABC transporter ATP-binding protein [Anaerobacillus isosaccharinicus]QOY37557.1 energy-coupling factor ABC transporter ATP-binding protein [Anaerobacillus isosaccharinicus]